MAPSTRSSKQAKLDDNSKLKAPIKTKKRSAVDESSDARPQKAAKTEPSKDDGGESRTVKINRAPVLELWAASVTSFLHPELPWETCLSIGGAISTLCAISKGRAIGSIDKPDEKSVEQKRAKRRKTVEQLDEIEVMHFNLPIKDNTALVGGKPKKANEAALKSKFGDKFDMTLDLFKDSLSSWKGDEEGLNGKAFHMYEQFRPSVPPGQKGWGRQGLLSLEGAADIIRKPKS